MEWLHILNYTNITLEIICGEIETEFPPEKVELAWPMGNWEETCSSLFLNPYLLSLATDTIEDTFILLLFFIYFIFENSKKHHLSRLPTVGTQPHNILKKAKVFLDQWLPEVRGEGG